MWGQRKKDDSTSALGLRYYVYISDTKIDALFAQVPPKLLHQVAVEASVDLKLIGVTIKQNPDPENRISRLRVVESYLRQHENVGSVEQPSAWLEGEMELSWGVLSPPDLGVAGDVRVPVAFFAGRATGGAVIGLGGSVQHLIGGGPGDAPSSDHFHAPSAPWTLTETLAATALSSVRNAEQQSPIPARLLADQEAAGERKFDQQWALDNLYETYGAWKRRAPTQRMQFIAKRLLDGSIERREGEWPSAAWIRRQVVLATPLYVSQVD
jgi:hypothetical protein